MSCIYVVESKSRLVLSLDCREISSSFDFLLFHLDVKLHDVERMEVLKALETAEARGPPAVQVSCNKCREC